MPKRFPIRHGIMVALIYALLCGTSTVWADDGPGPAPNPAHAAAMAKAEAEVRSGNIPTFGSQEEADNHFKQQEQVRERAEAAEFEVVKAQAAKNEREFWQGFKATTHNMSQGIVADLDPSDPQRQATEKAQAELEANIDKDSEARAKEIENSQYEAPKYDVPKVLISENWQ